MTDELDLPDSFFQPGAEEAPRSLGGGIDLSELLASLDRDTSTPTEPPPSLAAENSVLWPSHSGLHASLLATSTRGDAAEAWQHLAQELAEESQHTADRSLGGALLCEAGRILIDRLGRTEEGELLIRNSQSNLAEPLLGSASRDNSDLADVLSGLEAQGRDETAGPDARIAAWIEFGQLCERQLGNPGRAMEAYEAALAIDGHDALASLCATDAALLLDDKQRATELLHARLERANAPAVRVQLLLDLADLAPDGATQIEHLEAAHATDPGEETALRRLLRALGQASDPVRLGDLYRELALASEDRVSASTALHLAFLTLSQGGRSVDDLLAELVGQDDGAENDLLPPLAEAALLLQQRFATGESLAAVPDPEGVLVRLARTLDDGREQALVREQLARLRLDRLDVLPAGIEESDALLEAIEEDLRFVLEHLPQHGWAHAKLSRVLDMRGETDALREHLRRWARSVHTGPGRAQVLVTLGQVHENKRGDMARAAEVYELAVAEDPENPTALRALGRAYQRMRRWPQAVANLQRQAKESDDDAERLAALRSVAAMAEQELQDVDLAIASLEEIVKKAPDDVLALFGLAGLARTHNRQRVLIGALDHLVQRVDDDVVRTAALVELGEVYELHLRQRPVAATCYRRALELTPGYHPALRALGRLSRDDHDNNTRLELLDPAMDPNSDPSILALKAARVCFEELGDIDRAIDFARQAYESNPDLVPARELYLQLLTASGRMQEAYDLLRAQDLPHSPALLADVNYRLGLFAEALARTETEERARYEDAALQHHRAALRAQPDHGLAFERARRLLVANHDDENLALALRERAAGTDPSSRAAALVQVARVHALRSEHRGDAHRDYEEAMLAAPDDPLLRREAEGLLRLLGNRDSLPGMYLAEARETGDTHYRATLLVEAAEILLASGAREDLDLAANAVLGALRHDPGNPYAVRHLERLLLDPEVSMAIEDAVSARAVRAQSDAERALFYLESGELLHRAGALEHARRAYMASLDAMNELAPAQFALTRIEAGETIAARVVSAPESVHVLAAEAREQVARAVSGDGDAGRRALEIIAQILDRAPESNDGITLARALAERLPQPTYALELLANTLPNVQRPELRHELALFLGERAAAPANAAHYFHIAVEANPSSEGALRGLVRCHRELGEHDALVAAIERFLGIAGAEHPEAHDLNMEAAHLLASRDQERAIRHVRTALDARPHDPDALTLLAALLEVRGDRVEALGVVDRAIGVQRSRSELHQLFLRKARLLADDPARGGDALDAVERAAALFPWDRDTMVLLAALLEQEGQSERMRDYLAPLRSGIMTRIANGEVDPSDLAMIARLAGPSHPLLAAVAGVAAAALDPRAPPPPPEHIEPAHPDSLAQILQSPSMRSSLLSAGEPAQVSLLLQIVDPILSRMTDVFPRLDRDRVGMVPRGIDPSLLANAAARWGRLLGLDGVELGASAEADGIVTFSDPPVTIRLGQDLWTGTDDSARLGLGAMGLARLGMGAPLSRSLPGPDLDLLIAACFEAVGVFNPITADPDPARLQDVTAQLTQQLPRRRRSALEDVCRNLEGHTFEPAETARALTATDLRLALLITNNPASCIAAAAALDGVWEGTLAQRTAQSFLARAGLNFLLSDVYLTLRAT